MIRSATTRLVLGAAFVSVVAQAITAGLTQASNGAQPTSAVMADLESRIEFLARRVASLEKNSPTVVSDFEGNATAPMKYVANFETPITTREAGLRTTSQVTAPFEVLDRSGNPIFVVADVPHESVARRGRIEIARARGTNTFSLIVRNGAGVPVTGVGDMSPGGALYVADASGNPRVFASGETGLELLNAKSTRIAQLTAGPAGAGQFWLYDEGGRPMVKAGTLSDYGGVGTVQVGPGVKCVPMGSLRVPDCMRGRAEK